MQGYNFKEGNVTSYLSKLFRTYKLPCNSIKHKPIEELLVEIAPHCIVDEPPHWVLFFLCLVLEYGVFVPALLEGIAAGVGCALVEGVASEYLILVLVVKFLSLLFSFLPLLVLSLLLQPLVLHHQVLIIIAST